MPGSNQVAPQLPERSLYEFPMNVSGALMPVVISALAVVVMEVDEREGIRIR